MQARLCGSEGNAKGSRHVGQLEVKTESKHEQGSICLAEATDEALDLISRRYISGTVRKRRRLEFAERDRGMAVPTAPVQL
jgi:hypothetical protein